MAVLLRHRFWNRDILVGMGWRTAEQLGTWGTGKGDIRTQGGLASYFLIKVLLPHGQTVGKGDQPLHIPKQDAPFLFG